MGFFWRWFQKVLKVCQVSAKSEKLFWGGGRSLITTRFARGQVWGVVVRCTRLQHRTCKTRRRAFRFTRLKCTRLKHRTCKTSRGHFASLVGSKKVPATWWDFDFFFPKNPRFWKFKLDFFPLKKVFEIFWRNTANYLYLNYLWPKFQ